MTLSIRPYEPRDLDDVIATWRRASAVAHPFLSDDFLDAEEANIANIYLPAAETWVAEAQGGVTGFIALIGDEVGAIFVDPASQRRGLGHQLMDTARTQRETLHVEVFEDNPIGRGFYAGYGFREVGRHVHDATGHPLIRLSLVEDG